nr:hypothetical protein [Bacteroidota bacterium]
LTPFQYNPVKKQLIVYQDIKIEIRCKGGTNNFGNNKLRSRWWDPVLSDMLLNYESLPKMDYNKSFKAKDETGCEYLIITPNATEFQVWADSIKEFRTTQGIFTKVVTLSEIGSNTASSIEAYINNGYNTWDIVPAACLLLGDYGTDGSNRIISPLWENYCISDNIYADVDALIALSVNGELIGTGTGTGAPVSITIPGQTPPDPVLVTVTKQNYFRYDRYVEVLPATGPYVVYNEIEINDISGNGNGVMETSESILASITGKNIGVENAENIEVSLTTTDAYITITDGTEYYGSITAGNVAVVTDAFSWVCISLI